MTYKIYQYMITKLRIFSVLCVSSILLTGCSQVVGINTKKDDTTIVDDQKYYVSEEHEYQLGEEIERKEPLPENDKNISIRYKVNNATLYDTPSKAGIKKEQIMTNISMNLDKSLTSENVMNGQMLLLDMTITNVNCDDFSIAVFSLVEKQEDNEMMWVGYPCYYSEGKDAQSSKYYHYSLLPGQSVDMKIGWYVGSGNFKLQNLYLTDNLNADEEIISYVDLGL